MDQQKIGAFLRQLRKEKSLTQEQLAEQFGVSGRTVSRWENGNNLPDLVLLVELADYHGVEIREILDGERKDEAMKRQEKESLLALAEYSGEEKSSLIKRMHVLFLIGTAGFVAALLILAFGMENTAVYEQIFSFGLGIAFAMMLLGVVFTSRYAAKLRQAKSRLPQNSKR